MLDWTNEQKVLINIKKIISASWRMNSQQMSEYQARLLKCQDKILQGQLGSAFMESYHLILTGRSDIRWSDLLKDAEWILSFMEKHQQCETSFWIEFISKLETRQKKLFRTKLGSAFFETLRLKTGLYSVRDKTKPVSEQALKKTPKKDFVNEKAELEKVAQWLMCGIQETKEEKKENRHFFKLFERAAVPAAACLSLCFMAIWLFGLVGQKQSIWNIQQMRTDVLEKAVLLQEEVTVTKTDTAARKQKVPEAVTSEQKKQKVKQTVSESKPDVLPQYREIAEKYPGLYGWLEIPGMNIDMPVMQPDEDKEFYLHHDFTGTESAEGAFFVDPQNAGYPQDGNTVIYGHNMKNGHMFGMLKKYADEEYFREHKEIRFDTIYESGIYEAVAILRTRILNENETGFRYYQFFNYQNKETFQRCLDFISENQVFDAGSVLQYGDSLLMLSTCEYSQENGRLVIVAKKM